MSLEERINNILSEKNAEIAKLIATEVENFKTSLKEPIKNEVLPKSKSTKKSVSIETPSKVEAPKEVPKVVEAPKKTSKKAVEKEIPKETPKEVETPKKKGKKEISKESTPDPKKEVKIEKKSDLSTHKCQHTIKSTKSLPRLCEKACTNGGEVNGIYYCATHFKSASDKIKETKKPVSTTIPQPKCQKIENLKLTKAKDGMLFFKLDNGDKIIFRLDNKTPTGIGMIVAGTTNIVNMNSSVKHTLETSNIAFDSSKVAVSSETPSDEGEVEKSDSEEEGEEEDKEIQIDVDDVDASEEDDEDGENDVEDDDEDEIEEEEASEEEEDDDE